MTQTLASAISMAGPFGIQDGLRKRPREDIAVCSIVKVKLSAGATRSTDPVRALARQKRFIDRYISLPFDDAAAEVFARIKAALFASGTPVGPYDMQIAAIALTNGLTLATH